jgi:hypothetical protein
MLFFIFWIILYKILLNWICLCLNYYFFFNLHLGKFIISLRCLLRNDFSFKHLIYSFLMFCRFKRLTWRRTTFRFFLLLLFFFNLFLQSGFQNIVYEFSCQYLSNLIILFINYLWRFWIKFFSILLIILSLTN